MRKRRKYQSVASLMSCGTKPTTQACALTGNRTSDLSLCSTMSNQRAPPVRTGNIRIFNMNPCLGKEGMTTTSQE